MSSEQPPQVTEAPEAGGPDPLAPGISDRLGFLLALTHGGLRERGEWRLAELGINVKQFALLTALTALDVAPSQQELGSMLRIDRSTMVGVLDSLEHEGLVERRRNPEDRREQLIQPTPAGRRLQAQADRIALEAEDDFLAPLSGAERTELLRMLRLLAAHNGAAPPPPEPEPRRRRRHRRRR